MHISQIHDEVAQIVLDGSCHRSISCFAISEVPQGLCFSTSVYTICFSIMKGSIMKGSMSCRVSMLASASKQLDTQRVSGLHP